MAKSKKNGGSGSNPYVTKSFCDERFQRSIDQSLHLEQKIDDAMKGLKDDIKNMKDKKEEESHFWRNLLGTIVGGGAVALVAFLISRLHF